MERGERRGRRGFCTAERAGVSLAGVSVALKGTKKAHQMETITLTGGNNTVPVLYRRKRCCCDQRQNNSDRPAAGVQINQ